MRFDTKAWLSPVALALAGLLSSCPPDEVYERSGSGITAIVTDRPRYDVRIEDGTVVSQIRTVYRNVTGRFVTVGMCGNDMPLYRLDRKTGSGWQPYYETVCFGGPGRTISPGDSLSAMVSVHSLVGVEPEFPTDFDSDEFRLVFFVRGGAGAEPPTPLIDESLRRSNPFVLRRVER